MRWRHWRACLAWAMALCGIGFSTWASAQGLAPVQVTQALFQGSGAVQPVRLPYQLAATDFAIEGELVTFKLQVNLADAPQQQVGVYVSKMALSGRLYVNGHLHGGCERGALHNLRCLHRPYLFETPAV